MAKRTVQLLRDENPADVELIPVDKPLIENSVGYWIVRDDGTDKEGIIENYNRRNLLLYVNFRQGEGNIFRVNVSYEEPNLLWFKERVVIPLSPEDIAARKIQAVVRGRYFFFQFIKKIFVFVFVFVFI